MFRNVAFVSEIQHLSKLWLHIHRFLTPLLFPSSRQHHDFEILKLHTTPNQRRKYDASCRTITYSCRILASSEISKSKNVCRNISFLGEEISSEKVSVRGYVRWKKFLEMCSLREMPGHRFYTSKKQMV